MSTRGWMAVIPADALEDADIEGLQVLIRLEKSGDLSVDIRPGVPPHTWTPVEVLGGSVAEVDV